CIEVRRACAGRPCVGRDDLHQEPGSTAARRGVSKVHDEAFESPAGEAAFVGRAFFGGWDFDRGLGVAEELSGQGRQPPAMLSLAHRAMLLAPAKDAFIDHTKARGLDSDYPVI